MRVCSEIAKKIGAYDQKIAKKNWPLIKQNIQVLWHTSIKPVGFGQFCCLDNLRVHSAAVRPSRSATALKNSSKVSRSFCGSSAVMPTSRKITCGLDLNICLPEPFPWETRTRIFPGCISAWIKLSTCTIREKSSWQEVRTNIKY